MPVAVILLNWNNWADTLACIESLRAQTYADHLVVVVDNGSNDESRSRLAAALQPPHALLENPENYGFARGCNVGIRYAIAYGAQYVWLLNNDTSVEPSCLASLVNRMHRRPKLAAAGAVLCEMDNPAQVQEWGGGWLNLRTGIGGVHLERPDRQPIDYLCGGCLLLRSTALEEIGLLDEGYFLYGEDADLGIRLRMAGWESAVAADVRVRHRRGPSTSSLAKEFYINAGIVRTLRKHSRWPLPASVIGTTRRAAKSIVKLNRKRTAAILGGALEGWRAYGQCRPYRLPHWLGRGAPERPNRPAE